MWWNLFYIITLDPKISSTRLNYVSVILTGRNLRPAVQQLFWRVSGVILNTRCCIFYIRPLTFVPLDFQVPLSQYPETDTHKWHRDYHAQESRLTQRVSVPWWWWWRNDLFSLQSLGSNRPFQITILTWTMKLSVDFISYNCSCCYIFM